MADKMEEEGGRSFAIALGGFQLVNLILYGVCVSYSAPLQGGSSGSAQAGTTATYGAFQDVHVMIFVGFGFLMTFLSKYGFTAVGINFVISALCIQWGMLLNGFWHEVHTNDYWTDIHLDLHALIEGDFAAATVAITFGALLGKVSPLQMIGIAFFELFFYSLNFYIGVLYLEAVDIGGSMFIHTFGAYFGLAVASALDGSFRSREGKTRRKTLEQITLTEDAAENHASSTKTSDTFAMIGTLFLWMFWPSFNGALAPPETQERVFINTVLALTGSCIGTFIWSQFKRRKLSMVDVQNATLAGGVAVGSAADLSIDPWAAILVGLVASAVSVWGYTVLQPWLAHNCHLHDTCGVHNLHGMPGIIGGISGAIAAASAGQSVYGNNIGLLYPARGITQDRSASEQGGYQALALVITLIIAIASGVLVGNIVSHPIFEPPAKKDFYSDHLYWEDVHDPSQSKPSDEFDPDRVEAGERKGVQESVI
eukprot:m.294103 g.294103  ORF g.294103 m.294103 type:complete len:482 (-) comp27156_c0_seq1:280-1725(-)